MASLVPEGLCDVHNTMQVRPRVGQNNVNDISLDNDRGATVEVWSVWSVEMVGWDLLAQVFWLLPHFPRFTD